MYEAYDSLEFEFEGLGAPSSLAVGVLGSLLGKIRKLLTQALASTIDPGNRYRSSYRNAGAFIGQCPVRLPEGRASVEVLLETSPSDPSQLWLFSGTEFERCPVPRRMALNLLDGLSLIADPAVYYDDAVQRRVAYKLPGPLLDAVFSLLKLEPDANLVVRWTGAPSTLFMAEESRQVKLAPAVRRQAEILSNIAAGGPEPLRHLSSLVGWVVELRHDGEHGGGSDYTVGIITTRPEPGWRVRVELGPEDYVLAVRAHTTENEIELSGLLDRVGRQWVLHGGEVKTLIPK